MTQSLQAATGRTLTGVLPSISPGGLRVKRSPTSVARFPLDHEAIRLLARTEAALPSQAFALASGQKCT
jgi:hypothetical protein